jgi:hypothetical protein
MLCPGIDVHTGQIDHVVDRGGDGSVQARKVGTFVGDMIGFDESHPAPEPRPAASMLGRIRRSLAEAHNRCDGRMPPPEIEL